MEFNFKNRKYMFEPGHGLTRDIAILAGISILVFIITQSE